MLPPGGAFHKLSVFQASNVDELSLKENECLELVGDGEGDGWVKVSSERPRYPDLYTPG